MNGMTRREFLQRIGVLGGSTAVFDAMNALDLMAAPGGSRPVWTGRPANARVIVLGAGLSGLATTYELNKLGYDVQILEARNRVGGVNHSIRRGTRETEKTGETQVCNFDEGLYVNGGPWRIPHSHAPTLQYCKELNVPLQVFINEHDASFIYNEDPSIGPLSGKRLRLREVKADMRGYSAELLSKALSQDLLDLPLSEEDGERMLSYLVGEGYLDSADRLYKGSSARGTEPPYDLSALLQSGFWSRVRAIDSGNGRAPMFQPIGGMDQIPMAFQRVLADKITLGAAVESIHQTPDNVRVVYADAASGEKRELTADYIVSCIPLTVLRTLPDVDLVPEMKAAVEGVNYSSSAKIGVQMARRFWEEDDGIFGGAAIHNLPLGTFAYPSNDFFTRKGVLLGFYGSGSIGGLNELPIAARIEHVVTQASKIHPQMRQEFETGYAVFWEHINYSNGAYGTANDTLIPRLTEPDRRVYIGCAATSGNGSWMEGAFRAAWTVVDNLHRRVMA